MSDLQDDALTINKSYRANSLTTSTEAAYRIALDWEIQCSRVRDAEDQVQEVRARLEAERDEVRAELTSLRRRVKALRDRVNELVEEGET